MSENLLVPFGGYAIFFVLGMIFMVIPILLGQMLRPRRPSEGKEAVYECGEPTIGSSWIRYNIRFYATALDFLIFDVEVVLLLPVAIVLRQIAAALGAGPALYALTAAGIFIFVLALGLAYAWAKGTIEWILVEKPEVPPEERKPTPGAEAQEAA